MIGVAAGALPAALLMGLAFGASACMLSCIPTLGVALLSEDGGAHATMRLAARFNAGRWLGYTLLGMISGGIGASITQGLNSEHAAWLFGTMLIFSGLMLWRRSAAMGCASHRRGRDSLFKGSMFGLGLGMSMTPCVPLAAVCASAAASGSILGGGLLGACFGLGAVIPAQLVLGYGLGAAGNQLRTQLVLKRTQISHWVGGMLFLVGSGVLSGVIRL